MLLPGLHYATVVCVDDGISRFPAEIFESVYYTDIILLGDFNFELRSLNNRYTVFKHMLDRFNLAACSNIIGSLNCPTYVNDALGHKSHIDNFFITSHLQSVVHGGDVIESCLNFCDHRPITLQLMLHADRF